MSGTGNKDQTYQKPEVPGTGHGGDIYRNRAELDFSVSLNPLGMPKEVEEALRESVSSWSAYPDPYCAAVRGELSARLDIGEDALIFGNGAAELIYGLVFALRPKKALICAPTFSEYESALHAVGCEVIHYPLKAEDDLMLNASDFAAAIDEDIDLIFLCNPNNPTGQCLKTEDVRLIEKACEERGAFLCVDETFIELTQSPGKLSILQRCESDKHLGVLRAFTKTYALAGLRLGYLVCFDKELIRRIESMRQPWNISAPAQTAGLAALQKVPSSYLEKARDMIWHEREKMSAVLEKRGFRVIRGNANFILFFSPFKNLHGRCLEKGILLRDCKNFTGLKEGCLRIGLRTPKEDDILSRLLDTIV